MFIKTKKTKKPLIIAAAAVVLIGAGVSAYALTHRAAPAAGDAQQSSTAPQKSPEGVDYGQPSQSQQQAGADTKQQTQSDQTTTGGQSGTGSGSSISVSITSTYPNLRVVIGAVAGSGTCTLTLTGPSTTTQTVDVQAGPSSSTCKGFDLSNLASGTWKASLTVTTDQGQGSATETFNVN